MVKILWHSQTKGRATVNTNFHLNHRATPRLHLQTLAIPGYLAHPRALPNPQPRFRHSPKRSPKAHGERLAGDGDFRKSFKAKDL